MGEDEAVIAEAWRGYLGRLRRRGSWHLIENHSADLFAQAKVEFFEARARGVEIHSPVGWLIVCAWRQTINLWVQQSRRPRDISIDAVATPLVCNASLPEEDVLASDQSRRLYAALDLLLPKERQVVRLIYLEGMSWRQAAARLGWANSTLEEWHTKAMGRLRSLCASERWALDPCDADVEIRPD